MAKISIQSAAKRKRTEVLHSRMIIDEDNNIISVMGKSADTFRWGTGRNPNHYLLETL